MTAGHRAFVRAGTVRAWAIMGIVGVLCMPSRPSAAWNHLQMGSILYSVFTPDDYSTAEKYPLIMFLHGVGGRGSNYGIENCPDMQQLASSQSQQTHPCLIYTPICPLNDMWVNVPAWDHCPYSTDSIAESTAIKDALRALDTICARYSVDTNRIILAGGSMGGYGVWDILCRHPVNKFAAAIPIAGGGDTTKAAAFAKRVAVWAFHGTNDDVVPVRGSRTMIQAIQSAGGDPPPKLTEYTLAQISQNGYEHEGNHIYYLPFPIQPDLLPWMFEQSRATSDVRECGSAKNAPAHRTQIRRVMRLADYAGSGLGVIVSEPGSASPLMFDLQGRALKTRKRRVP